MLTINYKYFYCIFFKKLLKFTLYIKKISINNIYCIVVTKFIFILFNLTYFYYLFIIIMSVNFFNFILKNI